MPVNWKDPNNNERLLACLFASIDESNAKINYRRIAELFGQGTTANSIECNFRKIKQASKQVREEWQINGGQAPSVPTSASAPATPKKPKTPKKDGLNGIKAGRVEKPATPSKKSAAANTSFTIVKTEEMPTPPAEVSFSPMMSFESAYGSGRLSMVGSDSYPSYDDEI